MTTHLTSLLKQWHTARDEYAWVLGTVYKTEGPCYRKAGAMMFFNDIGQQLGMLSGGCLESDIHKHARQVMHSGKTITITYDGSDEDDLSFQLGIGCGGTVHILLQPVTPDNHYLQLDKLHQALINRQAACYRQLIMQGDTEHKNELSLVTNTFSNAQILPRSQLSHEYDQQWLSTRITPEPHLIVVGGGVDARPMVSIARELGWLVTLWDRRPANARREFFPQANWIQRGTADALAQHAREHTANAAVLMSHNVQLDANALQALQDTDIQYMALLGPKSRRKQVLDTAALSEDNLSAPLAGPAGLYLGGELPESIALSILAECHACLNTAHAKSLSQILI